MPRVARLISRQHTDSMIHEERAARVARPILLVLVAAALTVLLQRWVGDTTIYSRDAAETRVEFHNAILKNKPPRGSTWQMTGLNGLNNRVFTVYLAEVVHRSTGLSIGKIYFLIESVALFSIFILLFFFCRRWVSEPYCVIGMLFFGCVAVLTYHLHVFQPWDRLSLLSWMVLIMLIWENHLLLFVLLLPVAMTIKWDVFVLPALYWLTYVSHANWRRVTLVSVGLAAIVIATFAALTTAFPGGFDDKRSIPAQLAHNWGHFTEHRIVAYPPLLAFIVPLVLAAFGVRGADRRVRAAALFGVLLLPLMAMTMAFEEVRAEMGPFVLVLPAALLGLGRVLADSPEIRPPGQPAPRSPAWRP